MLKKEARKVKRYERKRRVRAKISGTSDRPRLSVFRSLRNITIQAIDDVTGNTLAQANLRELGKKGENTVLGATAVGKLMAKRLVAQNILQGVFDRSGYKYHGKVKALAEALRENGVKI